MSDWAPNLRRRNLVIYRGADGHNYAEWLWASGPKVSGYYAGTRWVPRMDLRRFVLVGIRRGDKDGPWTEILSVGSGEEVPVTESGWIEPKFLEAARSA